MTRNTFSFVPLLLASPLLMAEPLELSCQSSTIDTEAAHIRRQAPGVVIRKSARQLQVNTQAGPRIFNDKPPFDEPFAGVRHSFCARKAGYILLTVIEEDVWTGKLVNEVTGAVTNGGESVVFSEDRRAYLTWEQPNGLDGNWLKVYSIDGRLSWSGFNFIRSENNPDEALAYLDAPIWQPNGDLAATAHCFGAEGRSWRVKLTKRNDKWDWMPRKSCAGKN